MGQQEGSITRLHEPAFGGDMRKSTLSLSILSVLAALSSTANSQDATRPGDAQKSSTDSSLQTIVVTGSLIPQTQIETASPTITITTEQMERQGFATVYDALRAQPLATGAALDSQFTGGFVTGAATVSLLGLDPSFTLYLINGHPLADYPLLYNGVSNFVDLANLPIGIIDHIDILPGNQSSIYGSSAIAGVINIILKEKIDGYELDVRGGGYTGGGGSNQRIDFLGSHSWGDLNALFALQYNDQKPIWGYNRKITASTLSNPDPNLRFPSRDFLWLTSDNSGTHYIDPGEDRCASLSKLEGGTTVYAFRPGRGYYCGSTRSLSYSTLANGNRGGTAYLKLDYKLNENAELYGDVLYNVSDVSFTSGPYFWESNLLGRGLFFDQDTGQFESVSRSYSPEEIGLTKEFTEHTYLRSYSSWGGVRGSLGSQWDYDLFYSRSQTNLDDKQPWTVTSKVEDFFTGQILGPKLGTFYGYPVYHAPNLNNLYRVLTPAEYKDLSGLIQTRSTTWNQNLNAKLTSVDLFELPAGPVGIAGVVQVGDQRWNNPTDPGEINGQFYGLTGTSGGGTRNNFAFAFESRIPIVAPLTADVSARYDHYGDQAIGGGDSKATYKLGLEYRPTDTLLVRGNYATAFRAPDMAYTFGGQSGFFLPNQNDYYRCAVLQPGVPLSQCSYYASTQIQGVHEGNAALQSVTAKSYGFGAAWSPSANLNMRSDYYNVRLSNEVALQSLDQLLKNDSDCLLGNLDIHSPTCVAAVSQVERAPQNNTPGSLAVTTVTILPINIANERVSGIDTSASYNHDFGKWGTLALQSEYNVTLKHSFQQYPTDPVLQLLREPYYSTEFKTIANASATWTLDKLSATVLCSRFGRTPNYLASLNPEGYATPGSGTVGPWIRYNASVSYNITDDIRLSGIVNNVFNTMPPFDATSTGYPYYNSANYNVFGRSYSFEIDWRFGRSGK
jgi:outer membrane receptor protein involved in Fe transport